MLDINRAELGEHMSNEQAMYSDAVKSFIAIPIKKRLGFADLIATCKAMTARIGPLTRATQTTDKILDLYQHACGVKRTFDQVHAASPRFN